MNSARSDQRVGRRRIRRAAQAIVFGAAGSLLVAGVAFANAPDPASPGAQVMVGPVYQVDGIDVARVSISGTWQWPTHGTDCNTDRNGVGYAIDWQDPNQPGNHVTTLADVGSIDVGAAAANDYNGADNEVHPTRPEASGTLFSDPGDPASFDSWHSGCGSYDGDMPVGSWGAVDLAGGNPVTCTDESSPSPSCLGGSHVYAVAALESGITACVLLYDVHGDDADTGGTPTNASEITAGGSVHNGDNGAEKNDSPLLELACVAIDPPSTTPSSTPDSNATPAPGSTPDPNATAAPTPPADPNGTPDPTTTEMPDTAMFGGATDPSSPGLPALVAALVSLTIGLLVAARRPTRLNGRHAIASSGPWSTATITRSDRRR